MSTLTGKIVLLTGASKGIGAATARALGEAGAYLVAHYGSDEAGALEATAAIPAGRKKLIHADFLDVSAARSLWREAVQWHGHVDVLVNNAALQCENDDDDDDDDAWDRTWAATLQVNVVAPASLLRDAVLHYRERGGGVVITLSSWVAQRGTTNRMLVAYAASKAAVKAATQSVAHLYASEGILAYIVAPGVVQTSMAERAAATLGGTDVISASLAMGEWVPPEEVAQLVTFLAAGECRHLSGATLDVNGASYIR